MRGQTNALAKARAGDLRQGMTDAERRLWDRLRRNGLGVKFRRQHPFETWVLDFVCLERKLVIEVDGSQHAETTAADAARSSRLERAGFRVLRFWNHDVLTNTDAVVERIWRELNPPSP